jgi:hypothetical protein
MASAQRDLAPGGHDRLGQHVERRPPGAATLTLVVLNTAEYR